MNEIYILVSSENDKVFLNKGLDFLRNHHIEPHIVVSSIHRTPGESTEKIECYVAKNHGVIIAGATTATGLPGIVAGYTQHTKTIVLGVRFSKKTKGDYNEDGSFCVSAMPEGIPLAFCGYNDVGFFHACVMAK
ncbi:hypothetical protein C0583_04375 [Candidatus Parcubacteria bacterium]|nr:MAG: hypothetical protein C0583_04375 [Candidatus Parcubacteria bacterium]